MRYIKKISYICLFILLAPCATCFSAASDETSSSRSLISSTASHHDFVTQFMITVNTPKMLSWLEQRQRTGRTLAKKERERIRAGLEGRAFDSNGNRVHPYFGYNDKFKPIKQYQDIYSWRSPSLLTSINNMIDRNRESLRALTHVKQKLAAKDTAESDDILPNFSKFCSASLENYINDRDVLPEKSVACIEKQIATLERTYAQSIQRHEEYKSEVENILDILDDFARRDLRENDMPLLVSCFPFMAYRYACNPDWN